MRKNQKIFYKVIRKKTRTSAIITNKDIKVKYPLNEWVRAKIEDSKLLVFDNKKRAIQWSYNMELYGHAPRSSLIVVPCNVKYPFEINYKLEINKNKNKNFANNIKDFWKGMKYLRKRYNNNGRLRSSWLLRQYLQQRNNGYVNSGIPQGAIACSAVKCLE